MIFCMFTNPLGSLVPSINMSLVCCNVLPFFTFGALICPLLLDPGEDICESNGLPGIEVSGICCAPGCPQCGGVGCGSLAFTVGLTASDCCIGPITSAGELCDDTGMAPCIIGERGCFACSQTSFIARPTRLTS